MRDRPQSAAVDGDDRPDGDQRVHAGIGAPLSALQALETGGALAERAQLPRPEPRHALGRRGPLLHAPIAETLRLARRFAEAARREVIDREGLHLAPEGALCYAAYRADLAAGRVGPSDHVVLFNTATGLKSPMPEADAIDFDAGGSIDYGAMA